MASTPYVSPVTGEPNRDIQAIWPYRLTTLTSWLVNVLVSIYYTYGMPDDTKDRGGQTIWDLNRAHPTLFSLDPAIVSVFWALLFGFQIAYLWHLYSIHNEDVRVAVSAGTHFISNNILQTVFFFLFVGRNFWWAEFVLALNFTNLLVLYFHHNTHPRLIHIPVASGPISWTIIALFWNGAIAVHSNTLVARILSPILIWIILGCGFLFLVQYKDYTMTLGLSILCASLGLEQYFLNLLVIQWSFAFAIMALLFIPSVVVGLPALYGKELILKRWSTSPPQDLEGNPLLEEGQVEVLIEPGEPSNGPSPSS